MFLLSHKGVCSPRLYSPDLSLLEGALVPNLNKYSYSGSVSPVFYNLLELTVGFIFLQLLYMFYEVGDLVLLISMISEAKSLVQRKHLKDIYQINEINPGEIFHSL